MLVGSSALRSPLRFGSGKEPESPFAFLESRFSPRTVFMDIGGDGSLAQRAAGYVERVYAIDVSGQLLHNLRAPCNLRTVLCDGVSIPVPEATVDMAWSGEFMDHLSAEDATAHMESVRRSLVDGGEYHFTTAQSVAEVRKRIFAAGFSVARVSLLSLLFKPVRIAAVK